MEENKTTGLIGEGVKTLPLGQLLKRIGPGLIATGIVIGPGAVTTAAMLGANYGYALIWLMFPIIFMGITFVMTTNWLAITTGIYNTYLGKEKKWKREDLFNGVMFTDALVHMISVVLISGAIILVGAIVLHPQGLAISAPKQLAQMLEPIMGPAARYIMGFALVGAGFSSLLANTQRGMVLLGAGIDKEFGLESKFIRYGCLICLAIAMAICYSFNGSPTQLILIAYIATSIATPIGGLFVLLLIWRKDVNEGYKAPTALRICMTISYIFVLIMTVSAFQKTIIPGIMKLFA